jgi:hypothetical protein
MVCSLLRKFFCVATVTLRTSFPREGIYNKTFARVKQFLSKSCTPVSS